MCVLFKSTVHGKLNVTLQIVNLCQVRAVVAGVNVNKNNCALMYNLSELK